MSDKLTRKQIERMYIEMRKHRIPPAMCTECGRQFYFVCGGRFVDPIGIDGFKGLAVMPSWWEGYRGPLTCMDHTPSDLILAANDRVLSLTKRMN